MQKVICEYSVYTKLRVRYRRTAFINFFTRVFFCSTWHPIGDVSSGGDVVTYVLLKIILEICGYLTRIKNAEVTRIVSGKSDIFVHWVPIKTFSCAIKVGVYS